MLYEVVTRTHEIRKLNKSAILDRVLHYGVYDWFDDVRAQSCDYLEAQLIYKAEDDRFIYVKTKKQAQHVVDELIAYERTHIN